MRVRTMTAMTWIAILNEYIKRAYKKCFFFFLYKYIKKIKKTIYIYEAL